MNHAFLEEIIDVYGFTPGVQMLVIETKSRWMIHLSYGAKKEVVDVHLTNGIIKGDAFSPLLFVLMIDPLIQLIKRRVGVDAKILYYMDDLKASMDSIETARKVNWSVKTYAASVKILINSKKSAI